MSWTTVRLFDTRFGAGYMGKGRRAIAISGPGLTDEQLSQVAPAVSTVVAELLCRTEPVALDWSEKVPMDETE